MHLGEDIKKTYFQIERLLDRNQFSKNVCSAELKVNYC